MTKGGPGPKERYESVVLECVLGPLGLVQHTSGQTLRGTIFEFLAKLIY